jgi:hypothetical protein
VYSLAGAAAARHQAMTRVNQWRATELYPESFATWAEFRREELGRGDAASARTAYQRASGLSQNDERVGSALRHFCVALRDHRCLEQSGVED